MKRIQFRKLSLKRFLAFLLIHSLCLLQTPAPFAQAMVGESSEPAPEVPPGELPEYVPGELIVKLKEGHTLAELDGLRLEHQILSSEPLLLKTPSPEEGLAELQGQRTALENPDHSGWYWWNDKESKEFKDYEARVARDKEDLERRIQAQEQLIEHLRVRQRRAPEGSGVPSLEGTHLLKTVSDADISSLIADFQAHPAVAYAEPNYKLKISQVPNDPLYSDPPYDSLNPKQWGPAKIQADLAWDITTGSDQVVVAVIDTGVDYNHPDLRANIWSDPITRRHGYDFVNDDNDPMDDNGHGTHCSGIANAVTNNSTGVAGISWNSKVMALKFLSASGSGSLSDAVLAIQWAVDHGADILSNSWGGGGFTQTLQLAIDYADASGCVFIAAAGNSNTDRIQYPAGYRHVISVSATDDGDKRAFFSNYGNSADVAAPGVNIVSTMPDDGAIARARPDLQVADGYWRLSGTSMACPHVSGLAALLAAVHPEFSTQEIESVLKASSDDISALNPTTYVGQGRVNAGRAVRITRAPPVGALVTQGRLTSPVIRGIAGGTNFGRYDLYFGTGSNPSTWTPLQGSTSPVADDPATSADDDGVLYADFDTGRFEDGEHTLRLVVQSVDGLAIEYRTGITVVNFSTVFPLNNDILKKGELITLRGSIKGPFSDYTVEYGEGKNPLVWKTEGVTILHPGAGENLEGDLASWDTSILAPTSYELGNFYTLKITLARASSVKEYFIYRVYLEDKLKKGWPQYIKKFSSEGLDFTDVKTADLDQDGIKEIIVVHAGNEAVPTTVLLVYAQNGSLKWSKELDGFGNGSIVPLIADLDRDGRNEIFVSVRDPADPLADKIHAFHGDGTDFGPGWPASIRLGFATLLMADLQQDGKNKIVARSHNSDVASSRSQEFLFILNPEGVVEREIGFPSQPISLARSVFQSVGNFDEDPELEIVLVSGAGVDNSTDYAVFVFNPDGSPVSGWPVRVNGVIPGSPAVGDVDGDDHPNVVVAAFRFEESQRGGVYVFEKNGSVMPGWPVLTNSSGGSFRTQPVLADLDRNGDLEISIGTVRTVYLFDAYGRSLPGWPRYIDSPSTIFICNVIGDINGDGNPDIITTNGGIDQIFIHRDSPFGPGGVFAWNFDGTPIDLNPSPTYDALFTEYLAQASPVIDDLDGDGKVELVASSTSDVEYDPLIPLVVGKTKNRRSIYVWSLDSAYDASKMPWPTFQHDNAHTGRIIVPKPPAPAAPSALRALARSTTRIDLTWADNSSNEIGFKLFQAEGEGDFAEIAQLSANVTAYNVRNLTPNTTYRYKVQSYNGGGASDSQPVAATLDGPPRPPSSLAAVLLVTPGSANRVQLTWTDNSNNEEGFRIYQKEGEGDFASISTRSRNVTTYTTRGLAVSTTYQYQVQSYGSGGRSEFSEPVSVTTPGEVPPEAPASLRARADAVSTNRIDLTWRDRSNNETGFKVFETLPDGSRPVEIASLEANERSYSAEGLQPNTTHHYKIIAYNEVGESPPVGPVSATTRDVPPSPPSSLAATLLVTPTSANQIQLTWADASSNETGFNIFQSADGVNFERIGQVTANVTTYTARNLAVNATYHYQVQSYNGGGESEFSEPVSAATLDVPPAAPTVLQARAVSTDRIDLTWRDRSNNETGFKVYDGNRNEIAILGPGVTHYSHTGLATNTPYSYQVSAYNSVGESAVAGPVSATTQDVPPLPPASLVATLLVTPVSANQIQLAWTDQSSNETGFNVFQSADGVRFERIGQVAANVTTYTAQNLAVNASYHYQVQSYNSGGESEFAGPASATTQEAPPSPPTSLRARAASTTQIDLTWNDRSDNETGFKVYQSVDGTTFAQIAGLEAGARSYSAGGLNPAAVHHYKVTAYNDVGESAPAGPVNATTQDAPPQAPSSLQAALLMTATSADRIQLTWTDQSSNETGFNVFQSVDGVSFERIGRVRADVTTYTARNLEINATYHYQVQAYNTGGASEFTGSVSATTQEAPPSPPTSLRARAASTTQIDLTWNDRSSNETGFRVYRDSNGALTEIAVLGPGVTRYSHEGLAENTRYAYKICSYNSIGNSAYASAQATTLQAIPASPSNLSIGNVTGSAITLTWRDNSSNEKGFRIYRSTDNVTFTRITQRAVVNLQTYRNTGLGPQETYYYKVTAYNNGGESDLAGAVSVLGTTQ